MHLSRTPLLRLHSALPLLAAGLALVPAAAGAATITVTTIGDVVSGVDGLCSLREAITASNTNLASGPAAGECVAGSALPLGDQIVFAVAGTTATAWPTPRSATSSAATA